MSNTAIYRPSRGDKWSLGAFVAFGIAIVTGTAVLSVLRFVEILGPGPTVVPVAFADVTTQLPHGTEGAQLAVSVETGTITVTELPLASVIAGLLDPIVTMVVISAVAACLIALSVSLMRGTIFSKRNTRLVATAGIVGLIGFSAQKLFATMLANGAVSWATDREYENIVFSVSPGPFLLAAFAIAIICTVFAIGERMQRDTEGLV